MESPLTHQALKDSHYDLLKLSEVYFMTVRDLKLFFSLFFSYNLRGECFVCCSDHLLKNH